MLRLPEPEQQGNHNGIEFHNISIHKVLMDRLLKGINLYLVGMMGAGKTTVGKRLAVELGYRFLDTDASIEQVAGQTIPEIFTIQGESTFRHLESQVLAELSAYSRLVVATGGGIVLQQVNWSYLHHGLVVWLDVPVEQLYARLCRDQTARPLLETANPLDTLRQLLEQRKPLYAQADLRVPVQAEDTPEQVAANAIAAIPSVLKPERVPPARTNNFLN